MYIYSLVTLVIFTYYLPGIRAQAPCECTILAWLYLADSMINGAYTFFFAASWFLVVSKHHYVQCNGTDGLGMAMINDTAGFTSPVLNVSSVDIGTGGVPSKVQLADAPAGADMRAHGRPSLTQGIGQPEGISSVMIVTTLWGIRLYCIFIMFSFARQCVRLRQSNSFSPVKTKI